MAEMNKINQRYVPEQAIVVYRNNQNYYGETDAYIEVHDIDKSGHLLEGKPLERRTVGRLARTLMKDKNAAKIMECSGFINRRILYFSQDPIFEDLIWYVPPGRQQIKFSKRRRIKSGAFRCPGLIFKYSGGHLDVYAVRSRNLKEDTQLYRAPFHNTNDQGRVCMGSAITKIRETNNANQVIREYEKAWWGSEFSEVHGTPTLHKNMDTVWRKTMKSGVFPLDMLAKQGKMTLLDIMKGR